MKADLVWLTILDSYASGEKRELAVIPNIYEGAGLGVGEFSLDKISCLILLTDRHIF